MRPDRNPDGFDRFRRAYVAESLVAAASAMPRARQREFARFLDELRRGERPVDPPEPPRPRKAKPAGQRKLL